MQNAEFLTRKRIVLIGLIIGVVSGVVQFWMLAKFTKAVTGGGLDKKAALFGVCQFLLPLIVLLGCAFLFYNALLWAAIGMIAVLVVCSTIRFLLNKK